MGRPVGGSLGITAEDIEATKHLTQVEAAKVLGCTQPTISTYRRLYGGGGRFIPSRAPGARISLTVENGTVLVGSDCHYWPGIPVSTAHCAFIEMRDRLAPAAVILNGDVIDGPRISRWPAGDWEDYDARPTVAQELAECQARLREIGGGIWTLGNHDGRFESYLIKKAPELMGVHGTRLKDHFPDWTPAMSCWINPDSEHPVVVKHRYKSGKHAPYNNAKDAGTSIVTGHLHALKVEPVSNYRGTIWGVDCGTMMALYDRRSLYAEDNPADQRSGFAVLTFRDGLPLWPEVVAVVDEEARLYTWRGQVFQARDRT